MTTTSHAPPAPAAASLSARLYKIEQRFAALAMFVMGVVVFFDVVHRTASHTFSPAGTAVALLIAIAVCQAALRMRGMAAGARTWAAGAALAVAGWVALRVFLLVLPNGLVWSQTLGLVLMLWVAVVGASMATRDRRHLALDLGSKLWPRAALPFVQGVGNLVTALFCFVLAGLAVYSLRDHHRDFVDTDGAGGTFVAIALPKWLAFSIVPVSFSLMGARFLGQTIESFRGLVEEDDAMHMLGITASHAPDGHHPGEEDPL